MTYVCTKCTKTFTVTQIPPIFFPLGGELMDVHLVDSVKAIWARGYILKWEKELLSPEATEEEQDLKLKRKQEKRQNRRVRITPCLKIEEVNTE